MSDAPKTPGPFASLCNSVEKIALRFLDNVAFNGERLSKIENRLALLDGGPDADRSARNAYDAVNADRRCAGKVLLGFKRP
jgi:hypothetical protein